MANQAEAAPVRGLLLIGVAVLIGMLFLSKGFDANPIGAVSSDDIAGTTATTVPEAIGTGTDTTGDPIIAGPTRDIATIPVYVANGSGVSGAAGAVNANLTAAGYLAAIPPEGSAPNTPTTRVYYFKDATNDYQADAEAVATLIGAQPTAVQPLPADPGFDIKNATVVVYLGPDLAPAA